MLETKGTHLLRSSEKRWQRSICAWRSEKSGRWRTRGGDTRLCREVEKEAAIRPIDSRSRMSARWCRCPCGVFVVNLVVRSLAGGCHSERCQGSPRMTVIYCGLCQALQTTTNSIILGASQKWVSVHSGSSYIDLFLVLSSSLP